MPIPNFMGNTTRVTSVIKMITSFFLSMFQSCKESGARRTLHESIFISGATPIFPPKLKNTSVIQILKPNIPTIFLTASSTAPPPLVLILTFLLNNHIPTSMPHALLPSHESSLTLNGNNINLEHTNYSKWFRSIWRHLAKGKPVPPSLESHRDLARNVYPVVVPSQRSMFFLNT